MDIRLGDCTMFPSQLEDTESGMVDAVDVVPCSEAHDLEVYHSFEMDDGDYPGEDAVADLTDETCFEAFGEFVGLSYEESELDFITLFPTAESWGQGDRVGMCLIGHPVDQVEGTLEGSMR